MTAEPFRPPRTLALRRRADAVTDNRACRSIQPPAVPGHCGCEVHHRDTRWTGWELCTSTMPGCLVHDDYGYSIELAGITSAAQMLSWIYQIRGKGWTDDDSHLTGLLRAFYDIFQPQSSLYRTGAASCPGWTSPGG